RVAAAYLELLRAEGRRAIAIQNRAEVAEGARVTANFATVREGRQADADRAATELELRTAEVVQAENNTLTATARLAALLSLEPACRLHATDGWVVPAPLVPDPIPLCELITIALTQRPELQDRRRPSTPPSSRSTGPGSCPFRRRSWSVTAPAPLAVVATWP